MHEEYGPIIRINPEELHIQDPEYYPTLYAGAPARRDKYGPAAKMAGASLGSKWLQNFTGFNLREAAFGTQEHDVHRKRRAASSMLFSKRSIGNARPLIQEQVGLLCQRLQEHCQSKTVLELHTAFLACTTDSVSKFTFGKTAGLQGNEKKMNEWRQTMIAVPKITPLVKQFPWAIDVAKRIPLPFLFLVAPDLARLLELHKDMYTEAKAFLGSIEEKNASQDPQPPPTLFDIIYKSSLPSREKTLARLAEEAFVVIAAGGDTVARALTIALYHLTSNTAYQERLRNELAESKINLSDSPDWARLHDCLYLVGDPPVDSSAELIGKVCSNQGDIASVCHHYFSAATIGTRRAYIREMGDTCQNTREFDDSRRVDGLLYFPPSRRLSSRPLD
ncbi:MAG: hypothetical protein Q9227_009257 [Pyrenula ochraceoflavens]